MHMAAIAICRVPPFPNISFSSSYHAPIDEDDLLAFSAKADKISDRNGSSDMDEMRKEQHYFWCNQLKLRRRRRRRRRRSTSHCVIKSDEEYEKVFDVPVDIKEPKSRYMTPKEEATFSWYLKERARIEAVRGEVISKMGGNYEVSTSEWAKAANMSHHFVDRILSNGRKSEDIITSSYRRLVVSVASAYTGRGLSLQDLTQEGSIGLLRGATKFDPERGYKLSTYAYWWIRQSITKAVAKKSKIIRLPASISGLVPKICEANAVLSRKLQRFPTYEEIAEAIDASPRAVRLAMIRSRSTVSLDQPITTQGCMHLQDIILGPDEMGPEAMLKKDMLGTEIQKLLECLSEREVRVLRLRYGLKGDGPLSFEDIGRVLKLSRERVRQIHSDALSKLRGRSEMDDLIKCFVYS